LATNSENFASLVESVGKRFEREYKHESFSLPPEVEAMPLFREWVSGALGSRISSPFWELAQIRKQHRCLDIGCGVSFLIYPWREWDAFFYGQEISAAARDALNSRGSQLNSKLFKGVKLGPAHHLLYEDAAFDRAIATGFSCYYPLDYWATVLQEVKRVLKPGGIFVFDFVNPEAEVTENWSILELYLGLEVFLHPLKEVVDLVQATGGKVTATKPGELYQMYQATF
jgi:SAM-dependent methyltransferase